VQSEFIEHITSPPEPLLAAIALCAVEMAELLIVLLLASALVPTLLAFAVLLTLLLAVLLTELVSELLTWLLLFDEACVSPPTPCCAAPPSPVPPSPPPPPSKSATSPVAQLTTRAIPARYIHNPVRPTMAATHTPKSSDSTRVVG
jgi:hypothetical protein